MNEYWLDIDGYEGLYQISNIGNVWSIITYRTLKFGVHKFGYFQVQLYKDSKPKTYLVQHLVAAAFIGPRPPKLQVCHNDGHPQHNWAGNLRYDTQKSNMADRIGHGTSNRGERHGLSKLSGDQTSQIRLRLAVGEKQRAIAAEFDVSPSLICMIKSGKIRPHAR
jgi:hypothetical protein